MQNSLVSALLGGIVGATLSALVVMALVSPEETSPDQLDAPSARALSDVLDELRETLEKTRLRTDVPRRDSPRSVRPAAPPAAGPGANDSLDAIGAKLEELIDAVLATRMNTITNDREASRIRDEFHPKDLVSLESARALSQATLNTRYVGVGYDGIMARFGAPDDISSNTDSRTVYWVYNDNDGKWAMAVTFMQGRVFRIDNGQD